MEGHCGEGGLTVGDKQWWDHMMQAQIVEACVKWIGEGETFGKVERTLKRNGFPEERIQTILHEVSDRISERKKGNGKAD